ncbi:MAG: glycosyltransferase [Anaerolineales bacterium]|nr:glycosyltransferase [Anaerolineales bacterium]
MKILFLSRWFPWPMNNGSKIRIYNLLRGLSQHHDVTLLSFADQPEVSPDAPEVREICSDVRVVPWREFNPSTLGARLAILNLKPRSVVDTFSVDMANAITETLNKQQYDLVIASQLQMAAYYPYFQNLPALFEEIEIGLFHDQAFSADGKIRFRHALTWFKLRMYLSRLLDSFQACTVASAQEQQLILQSFPSYKKMVKIIPNCLNVDEYKNINVEKKSNTLIFSGPFKYKANYDAMLWFVGEVFPLVLEKKPDTQLIITGDHANLPLPSLRNITLAGYVDDIKARIASSTISIAPLLSGGGTRLKILEAMALGTSVVATSKGAEGLDARTEEHLVIADSADTFASSILQLFQETDLRQKLVENSQKLVYEKYDWGGVMPTFLELLEKSIRKN